MIGMVLSAAYAGRARDVVRAAEEDGLMVLAAGQDVVRLLPALTVSESQILEGGRLLRRALKRLKPEVY
jgi:acetylornithine/succinyldiaminopimelate/putrescine aminotransferase